MSVFTISRASTFASGVPSGTKSKNALEVGPVWPPIMIATRVRRLASYGTDFIPTGVFTAETSVAYTYV